MEFYNVFANWLPVALCVPEPGYIALHVVCCKVTINLPLCGNNKQNVSVPLNAPSRQFFKNVSNSTFFLLVKKLSNLGNYYE